MRGLSQQQQDCLRLLGKQVVAQLELRIANASLTTVNASLATANSNLASALARIEEANAVRDALQAKNAESEAALHTLKSAFVAVVSHEARARSSLLRPPRECS